MRVVNGLKLVFGRMKKREENSLMELTGEINERGWELVYYMDMESRSLLITYICKFKTQKKGKNSCESVLELLDEHRMD